MRIAPAALFLALAGSAGALAAPDGVPVIDVVAGRMQSQSYSSPLAGLSVSEEAATIPGVRLERQGMGSPQADLRVRGGAFSSSGYAVEGLALFNPQTEHFQADLPLAPLMADSVRLLTGLEEFRQMSGHASGTVALDLAEPEDHATADLTAGTAGLFASSLSAGCNSPLAQGATQGETVFAEYDQMDRTDGYRDNDLARWSGGALAEYTDPARSSRAELLGTLSSRRFGARGFYGAPATLASEEEVSSSLLLGGLKSLSPETPGRVTAAWEHGDDRYWLDRHDRGLYFNHHRTEEFGVHADAAPRFSPAWSLPLRGDYNGESIDSDYQGRLPSTGLGTHSRNRLALGALPEWTTGPVTLSAGGAGEWFDTDKPAWLPAAGASWRPAADHTVFAGVSTAVRQPSYTELNYDSPGSLGNRNLKRQESVRSEIGWQYGDDRDRVGATVFRDDARRVVDWIKTDAAARWTAVNLETVRTLGFLAYASRRIGDRWSVNGEYMGLDKRADDPVYASRYALDYARHEVRAGVRYAPVPDWQIGWWQTAAFYRDNPVRQGGDVQLESNLEAQARFNRCGLTMSAGIANLWDSDFQALPGQPPAERLIYVSASLAL